MSVELIIHNHTRRAVNTQWLARQLKKLLGLQKVRHGSWSITIVGNHEMAKLHAQTMNDPTPTDVLTFDLRDKPSQKSPLDLDTVLCRDVAATNAKKHHHPLDHELLLYALHSLLHVQGYDDLTPTDHARMHKREDALLKRLGLGPLYAPTT